MKLSKFLHHDKTEGARRGGTGDPGYDAQTDLALPDHQGDVGHPDAFIPYGGMLAPDAGGAGYDAKRDTGISP